MDELNGGRRTTDNMSRLDRLEQNYLQLERSMSQLKADLALVKVEQVHVKDLFDARFKVQDKVLDLQSEKLDKILGLVQSLLSEPEKTPGGRALFSGIEAVSRDLSKAATQVTQLEKWQQQVTGAMSLVKWTGVTVLGLLALAAAKTIFDLIAKVVTP
jgi:hypothetical protein